MSAVRLRNRGLSTVLACAVVVACEPTREPASADAVLTAAIQSQLGTFTTFQPWALEVQAETSAVVPALVYSWGWFVPACDHCSVPEAVVGTWAGGSHVLRTARDWARVTAEWAPASPDAAMAGCKELIATTVARPERPVIVQDRTGPDSAFAVAILADIVRRFADSSSIPRGLSLVTFLSDSGQSLFQRHRRRFEAPQARLDRARTWRVTVWALQARGAFRYTCSFPPPRWWNRARSDVVVDDSIRWPAAGH